MATLTSTSVLIPLGTLTHSNNLISHRETLRNNSRSAPDPSASDADPILEASRLADSDVPDGGRGWLIVAACAVVSWWFTGISYSWGVIQAALLSEGIGSPSTLAFVGSLSTALIGALAIINSQIIRWTGSRCTAVVGVWFLGISTLTSSFTVRNVPALFFTGGILLGVGLR
jgi:hypothetical protein